LKKCAEDAAAAAVPLRGPLLNETHATIRVTAPLFRRRFSLFVAGSSSSRIPHLHI